MPERVALVADLHLGAGIDREWHSAAASFADFVGSLRDLGCARLVVLGDFLELLKPRTDADVRSEGDAERCQRILDGVPRITEALREFVRSAGRLDVLVGNHDAALARQSVGRRLLERVVDSDMGSAAIVPWFMVVPGVLYAEHGHQHHDINRCPRILDPETTNPERPFHPPGAALLLASDAPPLGRASAVWKAMSASSSLEATATRGAYRERIEEYGRAQGLPGGVATRIHAASAFSRYRMARRVALRTVRRDPPDAYLRRAAVEVDRVLDSSGCGQPVVAFGHTHVARVTPMASGTIYANPGTWSPLAGATGRYPYLVLTHGDGAAAVQQHRWG